MKKEITKERLYEHIKALECRLYWLSMKCAGLKSADHGPIRAEMDATKFALNLMMGKADDLDANLIEIKILKSANEKLIEDWANEAWERDQLKEANKIMKVAIEKAISMMPGNTDEPTWPTKTLRVALDNILNLKNKI